MVGAAYASGQKTSAPRISASRDSSRIIHRELVSNITGSTAFTVANTLAINPGIAATFPWLSTQAPAWEQYRFNKLKFEYFTRTGSNIPGSFSIIPDYDAADAAPLSEQIASSYEDVCEDAPWKDMVCTLRPSAMHSTGPRKFIRTGPLAANLDIKTYDVANVFLATVDGTAVSWGKLWVEYDITLFTPQLPAGGFALSAQHFNPALNAAPTTANILGNAVGVSNATSSALATVAGSVVTFLQAGKFLVNYSATSTTDTITGVPAVGAGAVFDATFFANQAGSVGGGSATAVLVQDSVITTPVGGTLTYDNTVVAGTAADLLIVQLPFQLL
jgi:hypothetical protein